MPNLLSVTAPVEGLVAVLSTGGTISSRTDATGARRPALHGPDLMAAVAPVAPAAAPRVRVVDVLSVSSFALAPADLQTVLRSVAEQLADPAVIGVVITHGTDTLEETAFFLQLFHQDPRPVVLTGAIRPADDPHADGPGNLRDAIRVAAAPASRERGVLVVFAGRVWAASGTRKVATTAAAAFDSPDFEAAGSVTETGGPFLFGRRASSSGSGLTRPAADRPLPRVDIVAVYLGADPTAMYAFAAAGARGLVLEGTGSGNAPAAFTAAVAELTSAGLVIALSSRVHHGVVAPLYGGPGGGRELAAAGAVPTGWLRPSQARIALMALLATQADPQRAGSILAAWAADPQRVGATHF